MPLSPTPTQSNDRPMRLAYMTSISEIASPKGGEHVGQDVTCPETGDQLGYREGHLEALAKAIEQNRDGVGDLVEIAAVIYHDSNRRMKRMGFDGKQATGDIRWPWPENLPAADGKTLGDVTHQVVMYTPEWREARKARNLELARGIRAERERYLETLLRENGVDVLLNDSGTYIFQPNMAILQSKGGRIINIHPAVTNPIHPDYKLASDQEIDPRYAIPGLYPTESALMRYNQGKILGVGREVIDVPELQGYRGHGATLHEIIAEIDAGRVIHARENRDMIEPGMSRQQLRHRAFELSREVLVKGVIKYAQARREEMQSALADQPTLAAAM